MTDAAQLTWHPAIPIPLIAAAGTFLLLFSAWCYRRTSREIGFQTKLLLLGLRALAILVALACLLRPAMTHTDTLMEKGLVELLLDNSSSMTIRDQRGQSTRGQQVLTALRKAQEKIRLARKRYQFERFLFGEKPVHWSKGEPDWSARSTAIGTALGRAYSLARGKKVAGILLFSDGANNYGPEPVQAALSLRNIQAPLYVFAVGEAEETKLRDARVVQVVSPKKVFTGNEFPVDSELHFLGMKGETVPVTLKIDGQPNRTQRIMVTSDDEVARVRFRHRSGLPGQHRVAVELMPQEDEISIGNNQAGTYVEVLSGGIQVLYLEGKLRPEFGFLRRSLEAAPNLTLIAPLPFQVASPERMKQFLAETELSKFQVILLGDLPARSFPRGVLEQVRHQIEKSGLGLAVLGGRDALGPGGYGHSPLASALPVQVLSEPSQSDRPTRVLPTQEGLSHFLMQLVPGREQETEAWKELPKLLGYTRAGKPKPAARVLARSESGDPLIVIQQYGRGRTAALLGDTTYRWVLGQPAELAKRHRRFWRQVILWLASRDRLDKKMLLLSVDRFTYEMGARCHVTAELIDEKGNPVRGARVRVTIQQEGEAGEAVILPLTEREDQFESFYEPEKEGIYVVRATATMENKQVESKETRFRLVVPNREFDVPYANLSLLKAIAQTSGGSFHSLHELEEVLEHILKKKVSTRIERRRHDDIWDTYPVFVLFVLALVVEWTVRRQAGLV